ncbi:serine/threonine protein kinase [Planctomycetaceae bacterium SCGC AG-212-D15]|nr:serine/threonine protein kinase [Planctomycetaceae bacterium SCGC AG-212-D15]
MLRPLHLLVLACPLILTSFAAIADERRSDARPIVFAPTDWPWWRGPQRDGIADPKQTPPLKWSATENVLWKTPIPGRGHGSPTVVGEQVFLATAEYDPQVQSVLCFERKSGKLLWQTPVHRGNFETKGNAKASLASSTVACDGERLFINFLNNGAVYTSALDRSGKLLWQTKISDYVIHQGYGSSPAVYESVVIASADNKGGGAVAALDRASGKIIWKRERPKTPNYASPIILRAAGRTQLFMTGCDLVTGLDPLTGKELWEIKGATTECVTSTVSDGNVIITSGGYPKNHVSAVQTDGSGKVVWEKNTRVYVPSLVIRDGHLYGVQDAGLAFCWKLDTGKELWKGRLGGTFSASPVLVGEHFFATNEAGRTFIYKASPDSFTLVGENQLGDEVLPTPTYCGGRVFMRVAHMDKGKRQEVLYCLGKSD